MNDSCSMAMIGEAGQSAPVETASGPWWADMSPRPSAARWPSRRRLRSVGLLLSITLSPLTAITDPWLDDRRRQTQATACVVIESIGHRRISRDEALRIARQILERAERERIEIAEWEANRGIQWGGEE